LNEQDRTALRPVAPNSSEHAGQSKAIQWASFKSEIKTEEPARQPSGLRAIAAPPAAQSQVDPSVVQKQSAQPKTTTATQPTRRYTGGWNVAK
jgi:hypothetical protein